MRKTISAQAFAALLALGALSANAATFDFVAPIDGAQAGTTSAATGFAFVTYDDVAGEMSWDIRWSALESNITVAHFHGPALPGDTAGIQVNFGDISGLVSPSIGSSAIDATQAADLLAGLYYINIHSDLEPSGEIRGQVLPSINVGQDGTVLKCTGTCDSFTFLAQDSDVSGFIGFDEPGIADGTFDGGDVIGLSYTVLNPNEPLAGPSDPPDPVLDNPFTLDPSVGGGGIVVANGQAITTPRGTFTACVPPAQTGCVRTSAGATDGSVITSGFIDLWLTEGVLAGNGAVVTLNFGPGNCRDELNPNFAPIAPPCFEVNIFEGLIFVAGGRIGLSVQSPTPALGGTDNTWEIRDATPGGMVLLYLGVGQGSVPFPGPQCPGLTLDSQLALFFGFSVADAAGSASHLRSVPAGASGRNIRSQVVDISTCTKSNVDVTPFL